MMMGAYRKSARHWWLAGVEKLVPAAAVDGPGDLSEENIPFLRLVDATARAMLCVIVTQARRAFDLRILVGEACLMYLAIFRAPLPVAAWRASFNRQLRRIGETPADPKVSNNPYLRRFATFAMPAFKMDN
ncbi:MAG: hypothetical protein HY646_18050 [Acidobacteria bacterium]|nr:hypothetical protein [Acidobacteriota bacterium]